MKRGTRKSVPSWRRPDVRSLQPAWWLGALLLLAMLLLEVWQQSAVASLSVRAGRATDALQHASNDLEWTRAQLDRGATRAEVGTLAFRAGVRPGDAAQVVWLPEDYLEEDGVVAAGAPASGAAGAPAADAAGAPAADAAGRGSPALLALAGRALQSLVPEAKARSRRVN
jgi:hypothetical protein